MEEYDLIVGMIADDSMEMAMNDFQHYNITDVGLYNSLKEIDLGLQVVAKSKFACEQINILESKPLYGQELQKAVAIARHNRQRGSQVLEKNKLKFRNQGVYLDEIIQYEKSYFSTNEWRNEYDEMGRL